MDVLQSRRVRWALMVSGTFIVSVTFLAQFPLAGVRAEAMLLVALCAGLVGGPVRGAWIGFASGLLVDLTLYGTLGVAAMCFTVVGFMAGVVSEFVPAHSKLLSVVIVMVGSVAGVVLYAVLAEFLGGHTLSDPDFGLVVAIVAVWNTVLCLPVLALCRLVEGTPHSVVR